MPQSTDGAGEPAPDERKRPGGGARFPLGMARTQQMGNRGLAAASIGWTLAGCIVLGFFAGQWLDNRFGTQFWTPVLFLIGVVAGFREMFRTLAQLTAANEVDRQARRAAATSSPTLSTAEKSKAQGTPQVLEGQGASRQRLFTVPPPPFLEQASEARQPSAEEVKRRLRGEDEEDGGDTRDAV